MAITKADAQVMTMQAGYSGDPPALDSFRVSVSFAVLDNDGSALGDRVRKVVDIWPFLTPAEQTTLRTVVGRIRAEALGHI